VAHRTQNRVEPSRIKRRMFFGWLSVSIVGGMAGGSLLRRLMAPRKRKDDHPIVISHHKLSVPRTKKD
jgi:hypothetical protein